MGKLGLQSSRGGKHGCTMVCHHWRSKGWCRLGAECKFLHPEEKCGASLVQKNSRGLFGNPRARGTHRVSDLTCSPPTNFVAFPPGGFFSAVHMPGVPTVPTDVTVGGILCAGSKFLKGRMPHACACMLYVRGTVRCLFCTAHNETKSPRPRKICLSILWSFSNMLLWHKTLANTRVRLFRSTKRDLSIKGVTRLW